MLGFIHCYCHNVQVHEVRNLFFLIYYCIQAPSILPGTVSVSKLHRYSTGGRQDGGGVNGNHTNFLPGQIWNYNYIVEKLHGTKN